SGGEKRANLKYAKAKYQAYLAQYEYAVQTAFKEVKDELVRRATIYKQIDAQKNLLFAAKEGYYLARTRYERGIDTYMNVLELQRTYYDAERALISTTLTEVNNRISLYKALGGGTQDIDNEQK
ncbi:MAG: TolC family protein, partial [Candidatus Avelusimicrobium sp.]